MTSRPVPLRSALILLILACLGLAFTPNLGAIGHAQEAEEEAAAVPVGVLHFAACPEAEYEAYPTRCEPTDPLSSVLDPSIAREIMTLSPDGERRRLTENDIKEISAEWSSDGSRIAVSGIPDEAEGCHPYVMSASGGSMTSLIEDDTRVCTFPTDWSPSDEWILLTAAWYEGPADIYKIRPESVGTIPHDGLELLITHGHSAQWLSEHEFVYMDTRRKGGGIRTALSGGIPHKFLLKTPKRSSLRDLVLSPDRSKVAFVIWDDHAGHEGEVYVMRTDGTNLRRLTNNSWDEEGLSWSPDGSRLAFFVGNAYGEAYGGEKPFRPHTVNLRSGVVRKLSHPSKVEPLLTTLWSPDGRYVAFEAGTGYGTNSLRAIFASPIKGGPALRLTDFSHAIDLLGWR